ncbi:MAG: hypothetical protein MZV64_29550 [Ignavibacteriales bacterium]|nr:hypothetical protein [Ignavibacteriales bacterium]
MTTIRGRIFVRTTLSNRSSRAVSSPREDPAAKKSEETADRTRPEARRRRRSPSLRRGDTTANSGNQDSIGRFPCSPASTGIPCAHSGHRSGSCITTWSVMTANWRPPGAVGNCTVRRSGRRYIPRRPPLPCPLDDLDNLVHRPASRHDVFADDEDRSQARSRTLDGGASLHRHVP